ncbi:AI-2E family transporter [Sphingomonas ginkgonis]|uniref:AI-2E family transporter n=1 Tax=Sphingomonas ginkgonis TaxID=2315330 RepID=UPI001C8BD300|nr:AI-2E family transporter [Sphingomonas ginkgonis]
MSDASFIRRTLIVIGLLALTFLVWQLRDILLMIFGAVVIAALFRSLADTIRRFVPVGGSAALVISVLLVLGIVIGAGFLFGAQVVSQAETLRAAIPQAWQAVQSRLSHYGIEVPLQNLTGGGATGGVMSKVTSFLMSLSGGFTDTLLIVVGGIFLANQPRFYQEGALKLIPEGKRRIAQQSFEDSGRALRLWLKAQLIAMLLIGLLTTLGLWLLGVPSFLALGLLAGLLEFIPFAGPILSAIPGILLSFAISPELALWTLLLYVGIQNIEGYAIQPMIQQWAVELPGFILLFSLLAAGALFGPMGIVFAAPLTVVIYVMVKRLYVQEALDTPTPIPGEGKAG